MIHHIISRVMVLLGVIYALNIYTGELESYWEDLNRQITHALR